MKKKILIITFTTTLMLCIGCTNEITIQPKIDTTIQPTTETTIQPTTETTIQPTTETTMQPADNTTKQTTNNTTLKPTMQPKKPTVNSTNKQTDSSKQLLIDAFCFSRDKIWNDAVWKLANEDSLYNSIPESDTKKRDNFWKEVTLSLVELKKNMSKLDDYNNKIKKISDKKYEKEIKEWNIIYSESHKIADGITDIHVEDFGTGFHQEYENYDKLSDALYRLEILLEE